MCKFELVVITLLLHGNNEHGMYEEYEEGSVTVTMEFKSGDIEDRTFEEFDKVLIYDGDQDEIPYDPYGDGRDGAVVRVKRTGQSNITYFNVCVSDIEQ